MSPQVVPTFEARRDGYLLTTDRARVDVTAVHRFLAEESYWAPGVSLETVIAALDGSLPVSVLTPDGRLAAFGRVITDYAMFAYLRDVYCLTEFRGRGLASWLATEIRNHPALASVSTWLLATRDAHAVYERAGYKSVPHPEYYMSTQTSDKPA
jgi:GNAT superfamily N-acetyltransferase